MAFFTELLLSFTLTLHSTLWHTILNKSRSFLYRKKINQLTHSSEPYLNENEVSLVFVHGRGGSPTDFDPLVKNLKELGIKNKIICVDLGNTRNTHVSKDSEKLFGQLYGTNSQFNINPEQSIALICLSKGGLVGLDFARNYHTKTNIQKIITIASPLHGTQLASFAADYTICSKYQENESNSYMSYIGSFVFPNFYIMNELRHNGDFIDKLLKEFPSRIPLYNIYSTYDNVIIPNISGNIAFASGIFCYTGMFYSHAGILYNYDVAKKINEWLVK
jgi:esterase/lipase